MYSLLVIAATLFTTQTIASAITGSGTANTLVRWSNSTNVYDSHLIDDNISINATESLNVQGNLTAIHYYGGGSVPTVVLGSGAGTGATYTITGTDTAHTFNITEGTVPSTSATIATITFSTTFSTAPHCIIDGQNSNAILLSGATMVRSDNENRTSYTITGGTSALTSALTYSWDVICVA